MRMPRKIYHFGGIDHGLQVDITHKGPIQGNDTTMIQQLLILHQMLPAPSCVSCGVTSHEQLCYLISEALWEKSQSVAHRCYISIEYLKFIFFIILDFIGMIYYSRL